MTVKKILISQSEQMLEKTPYINLISKFGVDVVFRQFIKVEAMPINEFRKQGISIANYTAIVFINRIGIDNFFQICQKQRYVVPESTKYFCTSELLANYVQKYAEFRKRKFFFPEDGKVASNSDLLKMILEKREKQDKILLVLSADHLSNLPDMMRRAKCSFTEAYLYRTVSCNLHDINIADYQLLVFFSPFGLASLMDNFPNFIQGETVIAAMGASTVKAIKNANLRLDISVLSTMTQSMPAAIDSFLLHNK